jgi:regulator of nucleoside diphosphate kinase
LRRAARCCISVPGGPAPRAEGQREVTTREVDLKARYRVKARFLYAAAAGFHAPSNPIARTAMATRRSRTPRPHQKINNMNDHPIYITRDDNSKLRLLLSAALNSNSNTALQKLRDELDRAVIIDPAAIPEGVVTMDSTVAFEDLGTNEVEEYTITFPDRANVELKRLSILAPIGTALIGYQVGDVVNWSTPGGLRQLKILRVTPPGPGTSGASPLPNTLAATVAS